MNTCPRCGSPAFPGATDCPKCGLLLPPVRGIGKLSLSWQASLFIGCVGAGWVFVTSSLLIWLYPLWLVITAILAWAIGSRMHPFSATTIAAALGPSAAVALLLFAQGRQGAAFGGAMAQVAGVHIAVALLCGLLGGYARASRTS